MLTYFVQGIDGKFYVTLRVAVAVAVAVKVFCAPWIDLVFCDIDLTFYREPTSNDLVTCNKKISQISFCRFVGLTRVSSG